jgi:hypothetical protein
MNGTLHNLDKINATLQKSLQTHYPHLDVKLFPTTIKHGLAEPKRITHVASLQANRMKLNEVREALVHVSTLWQQTSQKIFSLYPPAPANGMIKQELYYGLLLNAHHEHMVNIRSFAISGISNLNAPMLVQANTDTNSSVPTTLNKEIILNAKVAPWN